MGCDGLKIKKSKAKSQKPKVKSQKSKDLKVRRGISLRVNLTTLNNIAGTLAE
jgi:hypothetical protein